MGRLHNGWIMARCGVVCVRTNGWNGLTGQENGSQARQLDTRKHGERKTLNLHHAADTPRLSNIFCQDSEWLIFCFCKPAFVWDMKCHVFSASAHFCSIIQEDFSVSIYVQQRSWFYESQTNFLMTSWTIVVPCTKMFKEKLSNLL